MFFTFANWLTMSDEHDGDSNVTCNFDFDFDFRFDFEAFYVACYEIHNMFHFDELTSLRVDELMS